MYPAMCWQTPHSASLESFKQSGMDMDFGLTPCWLQVLQSLSNKSSRFRSDAAWLARHTGSYQPWGESRTWKSLPHPFRQYASRFLAPNLAETGRKGRSFRQGLKSTPVDQILSTFQLQNSSTSLATNDRVDSVKQFSDPTFPTNFASEPIRYDVTEYISTPTTPLIPATLLPGRPKPTRSCCSWMPVSHGRGRRGQYGIM